METRNTMTMAPLLAGAYRLGEVIGEGGMGVVYRGEHAVLDRAAAVKVLRGHLLGDAGAVERFLGDARTLAQLKHVGLPVVYECGQLADGRPFIAMELLRGETLHARLARVGALPLATALHVAWGVLSPLAVAHAGGVFHRDLKPENIFLAVDEAAPASADGETLAPAPPPSVKLLDFGIARLSLQPGPRLTQPGMLLGTALYIAPEQCLSSTVDARADLYSLGCILFEMVCGRTPFVGRSFGELAAAHVRDPPPPLRAYAPRAPLRLERLLARLLDKEPAQRPASADEVLAEIQEIGLECPDEAALAELHEPGSEVLDEAAPAEGSARSPRLEYRANRVTTLGHAAVAIPNPAIEDSATPARHRSVAQVSGVLLLAAAGVVIVIWGATTGRRPPLAASLPTGTGALLEGASDGALEPTPTATHRSVQDDDVVRKLAPPTTPTATAAAAAPGSEPAPRVTQLSPVVNVTWTIRSSPSGAAVTCDGDLMGTTPVRIERTSTRGRHRCVLALAGHTTASIDLPGAADVWREVQLDGFNAPRERWRARAHQPPRRVDASGSSGRGLKLVNPFSEGGR